MCLLLSLLTSIWLVSKRGFLRRMNGSVSSLFAGTSEHSHRIWKVRPQRQAEVPGLLDEFPLSLLETPCPQVLPIQARSRLFLVWPQIISLDLRAVCNNFRKKNWILSLFGSAEELRTPLCVSPPPPLRFSLPPGPPRFLPNKRNFCHPNLAINDV